MTVSMSPALHAVKGVLVDPPLGAVSIDLTEDRVDMRFANAHVESYPVSEVGFIGHADRSVALNWAGTPIIFRCADGAQTEHFRNRLDHADSPSAPSSQLRRLRLGFGNDPSR